ncbi:unnamed protein product [Fraxinus pennsylvanica]|uniref:Reverse transcriptase domain-containing protein n=1 Tax=Fraxinus pennsylvanica TaxID=56036 RepID=A0AAD1ZE68_9LAMI|nr:unnamed protein product [Fraxinus pennsylvanica]
MMVDSTVRYELLSFMNAFFGYNQILIHPTDQEKTAFVTEQGTFCYKVMSFGLKNAGATYQRLVNCMFVDQLEKSMEVYIDDMLKVQRLTGRLVALNRFISRSSDKCQKFYSILRKNKTFEWTPAFEEALQQLKQYLTLPPLLSKIKDGEQLYMYWQYRRRLSV